MTDPAIGSVIVRHIDELEAALRHAHNSMQPMLAKEVAKAIEEKREAYGWAGNIPEDLDKDMWLAPDEWRTAGDTDDNFDLFLELYANPCIDGDEPETWVGTFCGFAGAGIRLSFDTNALGQRAWKALLRSQAAVIDDLIARGFWCDPKKGELAVLVSIEREALAEAFEEEDFTAALQPIGDALDRIQAARPVLDRVVGAVRKGS
jgi:hypothetical protein